jgi:hypothetical protein
MSLQDVFQAQKQGVAGLIHALYGTDGAALAEILERELGEQVRYDHREVAPAELDAVWKGLPSIASRLGSGTAADLETLKGSSYAFRLMTLAQSLTRLPPASQGAFQAILDDFGLGRKEVEAYVADFVK